METTEELFPGVTVETIETHEEIPARRGIVVESRPDGRLVVHYGDEVVVGPRELWRRVGAPLGRQDVERCLDARIPWRP